MAAFVLAGGLGDCGAKPFIRDAFFDYYGPLYSNPDDLDEELTDTVLYTVPGKTGHCGVCHYDVVNGGGPRTPYGDALDALGGDGGVKKNNAAGFIETLDTQDSDTDGYFTRTEVTDMLYYNTPTFPGLKASNFGQVVAGTAQLAAMSDHLTPMITEDNTPPSVTVVVPNGGESWTANEARTVMWLASDDSGIAAVHIYESLDDGVTYRPIAVGLENTGSYSWIPSNRPTTTAKLRIEAVDNAANSGDDQSDAAFTIVSPVVTPPPPPAAQPVPTTLRDFDMPGSQPFEGGPEATDPSDCADCHGDYDPAVEPYRNWQGSMMALASLDPLFLANLTIANQDAPESGDLCLRCHDSRGWLEGRSVPTDGSSMEEDDLIGVSCDLCHRMVDPIYEAGVSPVRDLEVLGDLINPGTEIGNGMLVVDPSAIQRGPFADAQTPHQFVESPFHREAAFCGTCHDVSNPAFTKNETTGIYEPNAFDAPAPSFSAHSAAPVERTYSEWLNSEYNTPTGVLAPEFAGNKPDGRVSTCQDCHMRDVTGKGCNLPGAPTRDDLPLHDMTGGSTWLPPLMAAMHPDEINAAAVAAGVTRATYMLENAASLEANVTDGDLVVRVTNETGHKLPTGYPEGRRIWINVRFFDATSTLIGESGAYDASTGVLSHDPEAKIYEVHPGIGANIADVVGLPVGPSLHFVLNNEVFEDNRIPPRGFTNAAYAAFGGSPVGHSYADGQYWDDTPYTIPAGARRAEVKLYYQSTSKEFIEFLRDENTTDTLGQEMYDLWNDNGKCPPVMMEEVEWMADPVTFAGLETATPGTESATLTWSAASTSCPPVTYRVYRATTSGGQDFGTPVMSVTDQTSAVVPLEPGNTSLQTYYLVVRATDACGGSETNTVELSVQPLLDPDKDQDGDGMPNGFEDLYSLDPFSPADALLDPDRDGLTSLEEAAYGSDPTLASSAHYPASAEVDVEGVPYFALSYIRAQGVTTLQVAAEVSDDLQSWDLDATTIYSVTDNLDGTDTVIERMNTPMTGIPRTFIRLGVSAVEP